MCSIGEDDFGDEGGKHAMELEPKIANTQLPDEICKKCNTNKIVVKLNLKEAQCKSCFFTFVRHKFRAALGSTRVVERGARVLLIFDGTVESCVMFDMIRFALKEDQFKRLTLDPSALFIDDSCGFEANNEKCREYLDETLELLNYFGFDSFYVDISRSKEIHRIENFKDFSALPRSEDGRKEFHSTLNSIKGLTARQDFVQKLRSNIIRSVASELNFKCVFLPMISSDIATTLLANVALGRGSSVADDISFCDNRRSDDVKLLRPIRTLISLEVETYVKLNQNIKWPNQINNFVGRTSTTPNASIQNLTKQFVDGLQENFASTVSTVFRTGDKITAAAPTISNQSTGKTCTFCYSVLDFENSPTLFAIEYSRAVSASAGHSDINDAQLMTQKANDAVLGLTDEDDIKLYKNLCHGCRNIFRDLHSEDGSATASKFIQLEH